MLQPEEISRNFSAIRIKISQSKIEEALNDLLNFSIEINDKNIRKSIILTCSRYHSLERNKTLGLTNEVSSDNELVWSILSFLDEIEENLQNSILIENDDSIIEEGDILQLYKELLNTTKTIDKLNFEEKEKLYTLSIKLKQLMYSEIDQKFRADYPSIIFNRIFFTQDLSEIEIKEISEIPNNEKYKWYEKSIIVSALSLSLMRKFNPVKIGLLLNFINVFEEKVWQRALVGLTLGLYGKENKLLLYPEIKKRLENLQEIRDVEDGLRTISIELNKQTYLRCHEPTVSFFNLHSFDRLSKVDQWFLPFYKKNPILQSVIDEFPNIQDIHLLPELITNDRHLSNSQKYAIIINMPSLEEDKVIDLLDYLKGGQYCDKEHVFDPYIADFYWFFKAFPTTDLDDLFQKKLKVYETPLIDLLIKKENKSFFQGLIELSSNNFSKAVDYFTLFVQEEETSNGYCRLGLAYYYNKEYEKAIKAQKKAYELDSAHIHSFEVMFKCYFNLEDFTNAKTCIDTYRKYLSLKSVSVESNIAQVGLDFYNKGDYKASLEYFQLAIENDNTPVYYSNIGYLLFLLKENKASKITLDKALSLQEEEYSNKNLGYLFLLEGDEEKSLDFFLKSIEAFGSRGSFRRQFYADLVHVSTVIPLEKLYSIKKSLKL